jgi:ribonuclease P protein component
MPDQGYKPHLKARILRKRADFLRVKAGGLRLSTQAFSLQYLPDPTETGVAVGFTCAKRSFATGVASNRGRRRLKEAWRRVVEVAPTGYLFVVVGKLPVLELEFAYLVKDLQGALAKVGAGAPLNP